MNKIDVLILIEHVAREMDVACILKSKLQNQFNLTVEIRHIYLHMKANLVDFSPRLVVYPFFYNATDPAIKDYVKKWPEARHLNLAWEEIFYSGHNQIKAPVGKIAKDQVYHNAWGNFFKKYLEDYGVLSKNIFITGNPSYQLYLKPYSNYFKNRQKLAIEYGLDPKKKWIFIPENYRWAFITDTVIMWRVKQGAKKEELLKMRQYCQDCLKVLFSWIEKTAGQRSGIEIVFRPKPATSITEIDAFLRQKGFEKLKFTEGFHIIKDESVREWILASDVVISSFSTTLIEAAIAKKPIFMIEPLKITEAFSADWYEHVERIKKLKEFKTACFEAENNYRRLRTWATESMLKSDPLQLVAKLCNDLLKRKPKKIEVTGGESIKNMAKGGFSIFRLRAMLKSFRSLFIKGPNSHENDGFTQEEISARVKKWSEILG